MSDALIGLGSPADLPRLSAIMLANVLRQTRLNYFSPLKLNISFKCTHEPRLWVLSAAICSYSSYPLCACDF